VCAEPCANSRGLDAGSGAHRSWGAHALENSRPQIRRGTANSAPKNRKIRTLGLVGDHR
jgi:hypothetical protein